MSGGIREEAGTVIWLTGISGSGKTTLGQLLVAALRERGKDVEYIDGDAVRAFFAHDLGFTREERTMNVKRIAFATMLLARHGTHVVVANIAPYRAVRDFIRQRLPNYVQVYLRIPLETVIARDVQGHYARFRQGSEQNLIGMDDPYEPPRTPNITIDTASEPPEVSLRTIMAYLLDHHCI